ncbi:porin [Oceanicoccus sagamiensis]|uniref:Porin domain-containing protein n=1 Tax=Oceanicoccus sagamiensis TaxID=716816 RepID=A0A1X9NBP6_9GAMM|nr:porin [Oceanicoccus sagamiensis]ARN75468.1 hypothetical protein BST96_15930 [Oceanicoccus sagamiensis]
MNYKLLPAAIAAATVMASSAHAGDVVTYGKINLSYVQLEQDKAGTTEQDNWELETFASRIGFKGSEEISPDLKVIYKLEYEIQPDGEGDDEFKARNSYIGLQGNWGTVVAGKHDTPLKMSAKPVDVFNDYRYGDIANSIAGERRENDIIMYKTPDMSGFAATIGVMPGQDSGRDGDDDDDGFADQISAALTFKADNLYAALAVDDNVKGVDTVRLSGSYKFGNLKLGALIQESELSDSDDSGNVPGIKGATPLIDALNDFPTDIDEQSSYVLSAAYTLDKFVLKAQYVEATNEGSVDELDNSAITIGVDYKLSKRTKLFSYYSELTVDQEQSIGMTGDYEYTAMGLFGIEHKF